MWSVSSILPFGYLAQDRESVVHLTSKNMTTRTLPKACVILGAGASFDVWDRGTSVIDEKWKPPLTASLFNISENIGYQQILSLYPRATALIQELATISVTEGASGIENQLRYYAEHTDERVRGHFKYIPPYLRDLLHHASTRYVYAPSCYVQLALTLLTGKHPHEVLFLVLNYDTLMDKALSYVDGSLIFNAISDYVIRGRQANVVKLHGSVNWFRKLRSARTTGWNEMVDEAELDVLSKPAESEVLVLHTVERVIEAEAPQDRLALYPLLTAPLAGKGPTAYVCPESHIEFSRRFLSGCRKFLVIGSSGLDEDLLSLLDSSIDRPVYVQIVDYNGAEQTLDNFRINVRGFQAVRQMSENPTYDRGFRDYLYAGELRKFARYSP